jgi:microcystin-dependent protein
MATVTGLTAGRMLEIEAESIVGGAVNGSGHLILTRHDGVTIDAGSVIGPTGPTSPVINAWPVGSIFMSVSPTNPNTLLGGGTWAAWGTGRVPVAVDTGQTEFATVEQTGGEKTHLLTVAEMASHTHVQNSHGHAHTLTTVSTGAHDHAISYSRFNLTTAGSGVAGLDGASATTTRSAVSSDGAHSHTFGGSITDATATNQNTGGGGAHNNLQPYITCYMWKRTA